MGYNTMTIRRLERDTSVDRLSTGSRESMQSTQTEWLPGEKKKSRGLLGKLKNAVKKDRNISEEREFGSGSDISSASVQSKQSTSSKMSTASKLIQRARSASKDRLNASKGEREADPSPAQRQVRPDVRQGGDCRGEIFNPRSNSSISTICVHSASTCCCWFLFNHAKNLSKVLILGT